MAEESKEIGRIGFDGATPIIREPIFVKLSQYKNSKYLDIRKHYEKDGQWCPTSKGITLQQTQIQELLDIINNNKDDINNWFK